MINLNNSRDRPAPALVMDNGQVGPGPNEFGREEMRSREFWRNILE